MDSHRGIVPGECSFPTMNGERAVFESCEVNPHGTAYVRFVNSSGEEVLYYHYSEWQDTPELVMGCILVAIQRGVQQIAH
jgi:hypothetical protein